MVNRFHNFVFMKVSIEKQCSSSTKPITCTIASSTNLIYYGILFSKNWKEVRVLHNLMTRWTSKGFCIANLTLFVMLSTNRDLWRSRAIAENKPKTHTSLSPTFIGWQKASLMITKWTLNLFSSIGYNQYCGK